MKRRTLDILFSAGGFGIASLLLVLGLVMTSNGNFAGNYVHRQLAEQKISFPPADKLSKEELASSCVAANAGKAIVSGKQAECYANDFIGLHIKGIADGKTYAELGAVQSGLKAQLAAATGSSAAGLQKQLEAVTGQRETLFKGETLRGLLLTSYGFSTFGVKADQAATVAFGAAAIMALLSAFGLWHAMHTASTEAFAPVPTPKRARRTRPAAA
ncbi:MAG: hypothetical protein Q8K63_08775 [Acidimicrobiales bacterium]|nr:hypothetical protein [Acidimicrobiales bacterium]